MNIQEYLAHFKGVSGGHNGKYQALCPAHDDRNPSLSITDNGNKILIRCHAGCEYHDIITAAGLKLETSEPWKFVCEYVYTPILKKVRKQKPDGSKTFLWEHKENEADERWKSGAGGLKDYPMYNQSALAGAKHSDLVFIVEGEKDVDLLTKFGRLAVCSPHGAMKGAPKLKWKSEYTEALKGFKVVVIPDNDEVGADFAYAVALDLCGTTESIKLVDLKIEWKDLQQGGDISDVFTMQGEDTAVFDILDKLAEDTLEFVPDEMHNVTDDVNLSKAERMLRIFDGKGAYLFHDDVNEPYAAITDVRRIMQIWSVRGEDFKTWLTGLFYKETGKAIGSDSVKQAVSVISSRAIYNNPEPVTLSVRVAEQDKAFWYDLTNPKWQAVKVTAQGWTTEGKSPILFRRYNHQSAQTIPQTGGDVWKILRHMNLKDNHVLFLCWLICSFIPDIPHALLIIHGEKGAAKTTKSSLLKMLIDPSVLETLTLQNDSRSMSVNLQQHWYLPFDNVSNINDETSDILCRAITGSGIQQRKLYSDADAHIFRFMRCVSVNGINNVATKADLLDRSILIELKRIPESERQELAEVLASFEADRADILGGIFDTLSKAMAIHPTLTLEKLPRMADFARWGYAIGEALGGYGEKFLAEYTANRDSQNIEAINSDPVATLIMAFMNDCPTWQGFVSKLLTHLVTIAPNYGINPRAQGFPTQPNALTRRLNGIKSNLDAVGIVFERHFNDMRGTVITINNTKLPPFSPLHPYIIEPPKHGDNAPSVNLLVVNGYGDNGSYGDESVASDDGEGVEF